MIGIDLAPIRRRSTGGSKRSSLNSNSASQKPNKSNRTQRRSRPSKNQANQPAGSQGRTRNPQRRNGSRPAGSNQNKSRRDNDLDSNFDRRTIKATNRGLVSRVIRFHKIII